MNLNRHIFICSLILMGACSPKTEIGFVGKQYTVSADIPEDSEDMDFIWEVTHRPEDSGLNYNNLDISKDYSIMTFIPDVEGEYNFEVKIFQYNDEIASQLFVFIIEENGYIPDDDLLPEEPEEESEIAPLEPISDLVSADENVPEIPEEIIEEEPDVSVIETVIKPKPKAKPEKKKPRKPLPGSKIPFDSGRFTIQVASKKNLADAKTVAAGLISDGFDAYIQKAYFEETDQVWFRVRVGSYADRETAKTVALSISEMMPEQAWVDFVRYEH